VIIEQASARSLDLRVLEDRYRGLRERDLKTEINKSKKRLADRELMRRGEQGRLTEQDAVLIVTESRRQHILFQLLAKSQIERFKRAYL
jgi:hypothetical protein